MQNLEEKLEELQGRLEALEISQTNSTKALFDLILSVARKEQIHPEKLVDILLSKEHTKYKQRFIELLSRRDPESLP